MLDLLLGSVLYKILNNDSIRFWKVENQKVHIIVNENENLKDTMIMYITANEKGQVLPIELATNPCTLFYSLMCS